MGSHAWHALHAWADCPWADCPCMAWAVAWAVTNRRALSGAHSGARPEGPRPATPAPARGRGHTQSHPHTYIYMRGAEDTAPLTPPPPPPQLIKRRTLAAHIAAEALAPAPPSPPPAAPAPAAPSFLRRPSVPDLRPGLRLGAGAIAAVAAARAREEGAAERAAVQPPPPQQQPPPPPCSARTAAEAAPALRHGTVGRLLQLRAAAAAEAEAEAAAGRGGSGGRAAAGVSQEAGGGMAQRGEEYDRGAVASCLRRLREWRGDRETPRASG